MQSNTFLILFLASVSMALVIPSDLNVFTTKASDTKTCPDNEFIPPDCNPTEPTCDHPTPSPLKGCPKTGACHCLPNFYRFNGSCVPASQCPHGSNALKAAPIASINSCKTNEQWYACGQRELKCNPNPLDGLIINMWCQQPGCYCASGFVRSASQCILKADCPKKGATLVNA